MIDQEFKEKEVIFENKEEKFTRIENLGDKLCILIADSKEILRFDGKERLQEIEISEKVGKAHTICSSGVLLISGDKGFLIYDKNLKVLAQSVINQKRKIYFVDNHNDKYTFVFGT